MNNRSTFILKYFGDRFIFLKDDWLSSVIEFINSQVPEAGNYDDLKFANLIFEQWKCSDFLSSSFPVFANHGIEASTSKAELIGPLVCQINSIIDTGSPYYAQYCRLGGTVKEDNTGFEKLFHEKEEDSDKKPSRLLKLALTDGEMTLNAIEFMKMPQLSLYIKPGCKILISPPVLLRKGTFLLTPQNCQLLGGECLPLLQAECPLERYQRLLKIEDSKKSDAASNQNTCKTPSSSKSTSSRKAIETEIISAISSPAKLAELSVAQTSTSYTNCSPDYQDFDEIIEDSLDAPPKTITVSSMSNRLNFEKPEFENTGVRRQSNSEISTPAVKKIRTSSCIDSPKPSGMLTSKTIDPIDEFLENRIEEDEEPISFGTTSRTENENQPKTVKIKTEVKDDADIEIIELVTPPRAQETPKSENTTPAETEQRDKLSKEEQLALEAFSKLSINNIKDCIRKMKYCIGSRIFTIMAIIDDIIEPLRVVDNLWTMKINVKDETENVQVYIDNRTLEGLIGFTCQKAIEIRQSSDMEKRKDGKRRLETLEKQLQRLDLLLEIEFFNDSSSVPVARSIKTMAEKLDAY